MSPNVLPIEIIDFSDAFFHQKDEAMPLKRGGKYIVMSHESGRTEYLVLSPSGHSLYHPDIVERFCQLERFQIDGVRLQKSGRFVINDPEWSVVCGGRWEWNVVEKKLRLYGSSQAYGSCHMVSLKKRIAQVPAMKGWKIDTR